MSREKTTLDVIAPSVEDAVQKGLEQLGIPADAVDVEILDAGSRGLFGLGSRQARIRLTIKSESFPSPTAPAQTPASLQESSPAVEPIWVPEPDQPAPAAASEPEPIAPDPSLTLEETESLKVSQQVVFDLLDKMKVRASVNASMRRASDHEDEDTVLVNIEGNDLSILIGRRTETLNALQYIASLIIGKQLNRWAPLLIDVQGYRARRERQLRVLARRMAEQALHSGRKQVLEPMPANERRIIHLELRDHPQVATESTGEEPNRKITIFLKK
jgi:spoIIIJ-associated protein